LHQGIDLAVAADKAAGAVIDLRNADEIRPTETPLTAQAGSAQFAATSEGPTTPTAVNRLEVPLDDIDDIEFWQHVNRERLNGTPLYYPVFLQRKAERCAAVIKAIAHTDPGGVLFHCGAGGDRTGLIALLLLALAGV
jgi:hypothetical protein